VRESAQDVRDGYRTLVVSTYLGHDLLRIDAKVVSQGSPKSSELTVSKTAFVYGLVGAAFNCGQPGRSLLGIQVGPPDGRRERRSSSDVHQGIKSP